MEKAKITFSNGTVINADVNGNCFIVDEAFEVPIDLSSVMVDDGEFVRELKRVQLVECTSLDGRYWFGLNETPTDVAEKEQMRADIDYIALETGIDL